MELNLDDAEYVNEASVPFCAWTVMKINVRKFTAIIGIARVALGLLTLYKVFFLASVFTTLTERL